jgi:hypothetical protein
MPGSVMQSSVIASLTHAPDPRAAPPEGPRPDGAATGADGRTPETALAEYRALEAGELHITFDLYERIVNLCGWPRG